MGKGADRKRRNNANRRARGQTWSEIQGSHSGGGCGGGYSYPSSCSAQVDPAYSIPNSSSPSNSNTIMNSNSNSDSNTNINCNSNLTSNSNSNSNSRRVARLQPHVVPFSARPTPPIAIINKPVVAINKATTTLVPEATLTEKDFEEADFFAIDPDVLDHRFDKEYNESLFVLRTEEIYCVPTGWTRIGLKVDNFKQYEDWHVAYHGTREESLHGIARFGLLLPGTITPDGEQIRVKTGRVASKGAEENIYTTPSIHYASIYAAPFEIEKKYTQLVLQLRVKPGSFTTLHNTLKNSPHPCDINYDDSKIAWVVANDENVKVYGILYRVLNYNPRDLEQIEKRKEEIKRELQRRKELPPGNWQVALGEGWVSYSKDVSEVIDEDYQNGLPVSRAFNGTNMEPYQIIFGAMVQQRAEQAKYRRVRRVIM